MVHGNNNLRLLFDLKREILSAGPRFSVHHLTLSPSAAVRSILIKPLYHPHLWIYLWQIGRRQLSLLYPQKRGKKKVCCLATGGSGVAVAHKPPR